MDYASSGKIETPFNSFDKFTELQKSNSLFNFDMFSHYLIDQCL
jgi:hypothetical protein